MVAAAVGVCTRGEGGRDDDSLAQRRRAVGAGAAL